MYVTLNSIIIMFTMTKKKVALSMGWVYHFKTDVFHDHTFMYYKKSRLYYI